MMEWSERGEEKDHLRGARVAAIGPTTGDYVRHKVGVRVQVVPVTPSADSLTCALTEAPGSAR